MKKIIVSGMLAAVALSVFADTADARWRRRRCCNTCYSSCNGCAPGGQAMYDQQGHYGPDGQYVGPYGQQPNTTFYRGEPNMAPPPAPNGANQPRTAPQRAADRTQQGIDRTQQGIDRAQQGVDRAQQEVDREL